MQCLTACSAALKFSQLMRENTVYPEILEEKNTTPAENCSHLASHLWPAEHAVSAPNSNRQPPWAAVTVARWDLHGPPWQVHARHHFFSFDPGRLNENRQVHRFDKKSDSSGFYQSDCMDDH